MTIDLDRYRAVQGAAKQVLAELCDMIGSDSTEESIAAFAIQRLSELGLPDTWYHSCPAFVLAGDRTCLSISGREYIPDKDPIGNDNLVTVDLSPCAGEVWGDCARSFAIERGRVAVNPSLPDFRRGAEAQFRLHLEMKQFVEPETRFSELFEFANNRISSLGFLNLDFLGNVGHSIEKNREDRVFADAHNHLEIASVPFFTFEPHIREANGVWGFKHENIYYFDDNGDLAEL